jgi:hypothetical protein
VKYNYLKYFLKINKKIYKKKTMETPFEYESNFLRPKRWKKKKRPITSKSFVFIKFKSNKKARPQTSCKVQKSYKFPKWVHKIKPKTLE